MEKSDYENMYILLNESKQQVIMHNQQHLFLFTNHLISKTSHKI